MSKDSTRLSLRATLTVTAAAAACVQLAGATPPSDPASPSPYAHSEQGQLRLVASFTTDASSLDQTAPRCRADFDADSVLTSADISAFVQAWIAGVSTGAPEADFNNDGLVTSADISAFIATWSDELTRGC